MAQITAHRYHDFSYGHRVAGHENACSKLHGHNGRVHFYCQAENLDDVGRVIDFSVIKKRLCMWVEDRWDHAFLLWEDDPLWPGILQVTDPGPAAGSVALVPFNPTAENMARFLLHEVGPVQLKGTGVTLVKVTMEETRKCGATVSL